MQSISSLVSDREVIPTTKTQSERGYVIGLISQKLKQERSAKPFYIKDGKKVKLSPISDRMVAVRVGHLKKLDDLYYLLSICSDSDSFSRSFFYWTKKQ